jgi:hypothetical protein
MNVKPTASVDTVPAPTVRRILATIKHADVLFVAFPRILRALLFDLRANGDYPPAVLVVPYTVTPEGQIEQVQQLRPGFATIERLVSVPWGGSTRAFIEQGVFPALLNRLPASVVSAAMAALEEIRAAEREVGDKLPQQLAPPAAHRTS